MWDTNLNSGSMPEQPDRAVAETASGEEMGDAPASPKPQAQANGKPAGELIYFAAQ